MISQHWFNWWIVASYMTLNGVTRIQLVDCQNLNASAYAACVKWLYSKVCNQNFAFNALLLRMTILWWKHSTLLMIWYVCRRSWDWSYLQYELHICESCVSGVLSSTARVSVTHTQFKLCHGPTSTTSTEGAVFSSDSRNPSWRPIVNSQWLLILWRHKELWYPIMNSATCCWDCVYCVILNVSKQRVIWFVTTKCDDIFQFLLMLLLSYIL